MARFPGATWQPLDRNFSHGVIRAKTLGLILHVQEGNGNPWGFFNRVKPSNQAASSHFWISKAGQTFQYVDSADMAWAEVAGNPDYLSVETEGYVAEPLNQAQLSALARLYAWGMATFGWPARLANLPGQSGLGYHAMGGAAWGGHPCPGPIRIAQRSAVLALIQTSATPPPKEELDVIVVNPLTKEKWSAENALWSIWTYSIEAYRQAQAANAAATAALAAVNALAAATPGADPAAITAAVKASVDAALADIKVVISTTPPPA